MIGACHSLHREFSFMNAPGRMASYSRRPKRVFYPVLNLVFGSFERETFGWTLFTKGKLHSIAYTVGGWTYLRRDLLPKPQVLLHPPQAVHSDTSQPTAPANTACCSVRNELNAGQYFCLGTWEFVNSGIKNQVHLTYLLAQVAEPVVSGSWAGVYASCFPTCVASRPLASSAGFWWPHGCGCLRSARCCPCWLGCCSLATSYIYASKSVTTWSHPNVSKYMFFVEKPPNFASFWSVLNTISCNGSLLRVKKKQKWESGCFSESRSITSAVSFFFLDNQKYKT